MHMQPNSVDGLFSRRKKKRAVVAVSGKLPVVAKTPVTETKPVNSTAVSEGFTAHYLYPVELVDSPEAWESENYYFGETPTLYMGAAVPVEIGAKAKEPAWYEKLLTAATGIYQQKQALKQARAENIERARAGLPPVSTAEIKRQYAPQASVEVGLSPQIRNMLVLGGLGVGSFLVINMMRKKG